MRINIQNSSLVLIDVQSKLAQLMHDKDRFFANFQILVKAARIFGIPIVWCGEGTRRQARV